MTEKFEKHIPVTGHKQTVLDCLSQQTEISRQQLKRIMQNGAVWLETTHGIDRIRRAKKTLKAGDILHIYYDPAVQDEKPADAQLIANEGDYSIWNKPGGMYSQGSKWGDHCTIYRWVEQNASPQQPAFIVHRLDRAANGLIILAHKKNVAVQFSKMFETRQIFKKYRACVEGLMPVHELPFEVNSLIDGKSAISEIVSINLNRDEQTTSVEIVIKTGRKHQIRRQLSGLGFPIVGDRLYGARDISKDLQLSSIQLSFKCPLSGENKSYELKDSDIHTLKSD